MALCLIVDDEEDHREIAKMFSEDAGLEVDMARDGAEALAFCKKQMPDVVILDWMMPVMDGIEFLYNLRNMKGGAEPHVVFCSARSSENAINMAYAMGADVYLVKPFDPKAFEEAIKEPFDITAR